MARNLNRGSGRLSGKMALITSPDGGIGRAGTPASVREAADVRLSSLSEHEDAKELQRWVEKFGVDVPKGRAAQPVGLAPILVFLASRDSSHIIGEIIGVTGGKPLG